ncbi:zinc transporter, ZIP family [Roseomonas rosea]|uniref:Zinc transporter, ZIP family n=1 Tax=Muricoccus roseus TaxID=198092 RepID=A0A1M6J2N6_9PROT|nr:zinc transporter, ZIP family [Roseomonas rosea]
MPRHERALTVAALKFSLIPMFAIMIGAFLAAWRTPGEKQVAVVQHLAAGVVFAAAATEILPQVMHGGSPMATVIGGALGVAVMLGLKSAESRWQGPVALLAAIGLDLAIDGLVLGLAFIAGERAGILLAVALTLEVLFLALTLTIDLAGRYPKAKAIGLTCALALLVPMGALIAQPVALLPPVWITGFLSFGLMALLYLVTEELLVEAHEKPDSPLISAMFFVGFLAILLLEEIMA